MLSEIQGAAGLTKDFFGFLNWVKDIAGSDIISAYFRYDGNKVSGSDLIEVEAHKFESDNNFFLNIREVQDYVFVRFPINDAGCYEQIAQQNKEYPDPKYWRWVPSPRRGIVVDYDFIPLNAKVDFIVIGYRPNAIIQQYQSS